MTNRTNASFSECVRVKSHRLWAPPADGTPRAVLKLHPFGLEPNSGAPVGMSPRAALAALHARCPRVLSVYRQVASHPAARGRRAQASVRLRTSVGTGSPARRPGPAVAESRGSPFAVSRPHQKDAAALPELRAAQPTHTTGRDTVRSCVRRWLRKAPPATTRPLGSPQPAQMERPKASHQAVCCPRQLAAHGVAPARQTASARAVFRMFLSHVTPAAPRQVNGRCPPAPVVSCLSTSSVVAPRLDRTTEDRKPR